MNPYKAIAIRMDNAKRAFVNELIYFGAVDQATAEKVAAYYLKNRIAKMDAVGGRISVKHGAFLDREVIERAAKLNQDG